MRIVTEADQSLEERHPPRPTEKRLFNDFSPAPRISEGYFVQVAATAKRRIVCSGIRTSRPTREWTGSTFEQGKSMVYEPGRSSGCFDLVFQVMSSLASTSCSQLMGVSESIHWECGEFWCNCWCCWTLQEILETSFRLLDEALERKLFLC